jgi:acyl-CoA reductase-like NAD-dependent aldehyde dehydrogenase
MTTRSVTTSLYIGGKERQTADRIAIAHPAKPGVVVGHCAAASTQDVSDAVASAKAAYPAWSALSPQQRAEKMLAALAGIAENRDDDAAILSQENGKVRFEAWIDSLVLELRWKLALSFAGEVNASKVLPPIPAAIPVATTVAYQPLGVVTIIVPFNWPVATSSWTNLRCG